MKKICVIISLFIFSFLFSISVSAGIATGHDNISKVEFNGYGKLLSELSYEDIESVAENVNRKAFGWESVYMNYKRPIKYEGKTIFSKINRSSEPISFKYKIDNEEVSTTSTSVSGSISGKVTTTIDKIKAAITLAITGDITKKDVVEQSTTETTNIDINIMPGTKLTLLTKGEAYITTAYSKYYIFGITIRKGSWEKIYLETIYYELIEEVIE